MVNELMRLIAEHDSEVGAAVNAEFARQRRNLELIASENIVSEAVMAAVGTVLTNKYAEGYPAKRYYGGCECVDVVENLAIERAKKLFGCDYANVQPHSGAQANMAVFIAMLKPGDTVMGMNLDHGGHLTHGSPVNFSGMYFNIVPYGVNDEGYIDYDELEKKAMEAKPKLIVGHLTHGSPVNFSGMYFNIVPYGVNDEGYIDYDELEKKAMEAKPKLIVAGASAYCRTIDFKRFREIADRCGAYLMVDMAHIAGLVAAGLHPSPIPYADVVTTTTHKTLRGPRGGMILANEEANKKFNFNGLVAAGLHPSPIPYADVVTTTTHKTLRGPRGGMILANEEANKKFNFNKAIFPGSQGGPLEHVIAAKAICFGEALKPEFKTYQEQVLKNAKALAEALKKQGFKILTGGTDNHLMLVDLRGMDVSGKELQNRCDEVYITLNKNTVPNDPRSPFVTSGARIGTPAITSRGLVESDMDEIARCVWLAATDFENKADEIRASVTEICGRYPIYQ